MPSENFPAPANAPQWTACPLCDQDRPNVIYQNPLVRVVRCRFCGMMYQNPFIPEVEAREDRDRKPYLARYEYAFPNESFHRACFEERVTLLERFLPQRSTPRVLDIGSGSGTFLEVCAERFPEARLFGVEPLAVMREFMTRRFQAKGLPPPCLLESTIATAPLPPEPFDLINMTHVLEHLPNPKTTLTTLRQHLAPQGLLCLEVPNEGHFRIKGHLTNLLRRDRKPLVAPEHINLFTLSSLTRLVEETGFRVVHRHEESLSLPNRIETTLGPALPLPVRLARAVLRVLPLDIWSGLGHALCLIATPRPAPRPEQAR